MALPKNCLEKTYVFSKRICKLKAFGTQHNSQSFMLHFTTPYRAVKQIFRKTQKKIDLAGERMRQNARSSPKLSLLA